MPVFALEFDTSVDEDIRKNYNPNKLEEDVETLPDLPKITKSKPYVPETQNKLTEPKLPVTNTTSANKQTTLKTTTQVIKPSTQVQNQTQVQTIENEAKTTVTSAKPDSIQSTYKPQFSTGANAILKKGTKIKVKLLTNVSDKSRKGSKIKFVSLYPVSTTYLTIPSGTEFIGKIIDSHSPQLSANGGLIKIEVESLILGGEVHPITAYVTKANSKKIFFNNIKGKRKYYSSMVKSTKNGRHFCRKMMRVTASLASDGSSIILTPFSLCAGVLALGGNIIVSPVLGLFHKGDSIKINSGNIFEIKLSQDAFID